MYKGKVRKKMEGNMQNTGVSSGQGGTDAGIWWLPRGTPLLWNNCFFTLQTSPRIPNSSEGGKSQDITFWWYIVWERKASTKCSSKYKVQRKNCQTPSTTSLTTVLAKQMIFKKYYVIFIHFFLELKNSLTTFATTDPESCISEQL